VRLHVQRRAETQDHGEDGADEDAEEIVHARAPAAQAIESLDMEGDRHEHADERRDAEILGEGRKALVDRQQRRERLEAEEIRDEKRRHAEDGVAHDERDRQQAVITPHHFWFTASWNWRWKRALPNVSACSRIALESHVR